MQRPYIAWSIEKLEGLLADASSAPEILSKVKSELKHRKTKRAKTLLRKIDDLAQTKAELAEKHPIITYPWAKQVQSLELCTSPRQERFGFIESEVLENLSVAHFEDEQGLRASEETPDDRHLPPEFTGIRPLGTDGLPSARIPTLDQDLTLEITEGDDLPKIYCIALDALIAEIKRTGAGQKRYPLEKGLRIREQAGDCLYEFPFTDQAELFEDARIEIEFAGRRIDASIVSISSGRLILSSQEDLGPALSHVVVVVDSTALLEALKDKIELVSTGELSINRAIADAVVGAGSVPNDPAPIPRTFASPNHNPGQTAAIQRSLTKSIAYIWGPPGTGKTHVLGDITRAAFDSQKRVLISSNTNKAVDQVLFKICEALGPDHPAMQGGKIVRMGQIALDKLRDKYAPYVTVDGIVERLSVDLKHHQRKAQQKLERIDANTARAQSILEQFERLDAAITLVEEHKAATNKSAKAGRALKEKKESLLSKIVKLNEELQNPRRGLLDWWRRSNEDVARDIANSNSELGLLGQELEQISRNYHQAKAQFEFAIQEREYLDQKLAGEDRARADVEIADAETLRAGVLEELSKIEAELANMRANVLKGASILGATCTKTYLAAIDVGQVDMVIIDEASMVLLPMIWFAAGRAKERVIVCGDFRQIPPIVPTRSQAIFDRLGHDVFTAAELVPPSSNNDRMAMLEIQYRMHDDISGLISERMYSGKLKTKQLNSAETHPPAPYDGVLTIIDTSSLWPFESVNAHYSRFNLMHALLVRNLAWHFHRQGYIRGREDLSVCTPYAAQAKLIRKLLDSESFGDQVQAGTVHSFQGDERNTVILELPEGYGGAKMIGHFLQGIPPEHIGARLINVAVSRAKANFVVLANLTYLDQHLPGQALLRGILHRMQEAGTVVSGSDLLAMRPIESDLRGLLGHIALDLNATTFGLFDGPSFETAVESDIAQAKESVVIFSGFVTPARVAKLGDLLRLKIADGTKVRCVTRPPHLNGSVDPILGEQSLDMLEGIGCAVDTRARIHEKVVLIDNEIVWHGSLNILSHNHRTDESMTRVVNAGFAQALAVNLSKRHVSADAAVKNIASRENPRCGRCAARTYYNEGRFGPYFGCEKKCGWSSSLKTIERTGSAQSDRDLSLPANGPPCPRCKGQTRLRRGRFNSFYGCLDYPACSGMIRISNKRNKPER